MSQRFLAQTGAALLSLLLAAGCSSASGSHGSTGVPVTHRSTDPYTLSSAFSGDGTNGSHMSMLTAGTEQNGRAAQPASNTLLQSRFPGVLMLHGDPNSKTVALTFDDGPDGIYTPKVLDVLKKHKVKATFFVMGSRVEGHPSVTKRIVREGHSLGNHTYWHPKLYQENIQRLRWEAAQTDKIIQSTVGYSPRLFRPPYGGLNEDVLRELEKMNFRVIGWSVDSRDWTQADAGTVQQTVLEQLHPGAIILMHSGGHWSQDLSDMVEAVDQLIPQLKNKGLRFVTIPQMLGIPERK
ncbi:polysaccharide deacetylase family protein [Paenibacillus turpanensis]|uniref:polysaccharide deacetylase family protein n=1 Tax=Paenibacillus turpanensis TaxID=2689078 RepID=UPI00140BC4A8|nr:polysaccharide deacetylase family protein [Paenibacillus turpanensis]